MENGFYINAVAEMGIINYKKGLESIGRHSTNSNTCGSNNDDCQSSIRSNITKD